MLDIGHLTFLEIIRENITTMGAAAAKGTLIRRSTKIGEQAKEADYTMEEWEQAVSSGETVLSTFEGKAIKEGDFYYLPACPFENSIKTYVNLYGKLPAELGKVAEEFNKPSGFAEQNKVGYGAGVSAFCCVHQPLRASLGKKIKIDGKSVVIYQLGCKAGNGTKGFADKFIEEAGMDKDIVDKLLDKSKCVYAIKVLEND